MYRHLPLVVHAEGPSDRGNRVRPEPERRHGGEVSLLRVGGHLEARAEEVARQAVLDDHPGRFEIAARDRRRLCVVPQLPPVLLNESHLGSLGSLADLLRVLGQMFGTRPYWADPDLDPYFPSRRT